MLQKASYGSFFFYQSGIWFLFLLSCLADLEKAEPQDLCCCQRASSFQRQQLGGKWAPGEGERGGGDLAAVCSCLLLPAAPSPDF